MNRAATRRRNDSCPNRRLSIWLNVLITSPRCGSNLIWHDFQWRCHWLDYGRTVGALTQNSIGTLPQNSKTDEYSIPDIFLIIFYSMLVQKLSELILKRTFPVMLSLIGNISGHCCDRWGTDGKSSVSSLPLERSVLLTFCFYPLWAAFLNHFDKMCNRTGSREI